MCLPPASGIGQPHHSHPAAACAHVLKRGPPSTKPPPTAFGGGRRWARLLAKHERLPHRPCPCSYSVYTQHKFWGPLIAGPEEEEQDEKQAAEGKSDSEARWLHTLATASGLHHGVTHARLHSLVEAM